LGALIICFENNVKICMFHSTYICWYLTPDSCTLQHMQKSIHSK